MGVPRMSDLSNGATYAIIGHCARPQALTQASDSHIMTAHLIADRQAPFRGLRPLDPRRDLNQVADLIEEAFAGELEPGGLAALRELRMLSRVGPLVGLVARSDPYLDDVLGGFVWIEDDTVVGNVTLQRLDAYGNRWQIANVAVTPAYRSRGIARALMEAALERIQQRRGGWAVLQVRADNAVARGLYERLGFEPVTHDVTLRLDRIPSLPPQKEPIPGMRPFRQDEWRAHYELAMAVRTGLEQWWRPVSSYLYQPTAENRLAERIWEWVGRNRVRRWAVAGQAGFSAWLRINARRWQGTHRLSFLVHPDQRGQLEDQLVAFALRFLVDYPRWPVQVEHHGFHVEMVAALERVGFKLTRNHLTMRKSMRQA